jgi:DNA-binding transcriptional LysR family regulator
MRAAAHFEELEEVADWVAAGRGISIVPRHAVAAREADGEIVVVRRRGRRCFNPVFAVVNSSRPRSESIQRTVRALAEARP